MVSDGAMGTFLHAKGLAAGECPESWCVSHPDVVKGIADIGLSILSYSPGRHRLAEALTLPLGPQTGYQASKVNNAYYLKFKPKELADVKKDIFDEDLEAIVSDEMQQIQEVYALKHLSAQSGTGITPTMSWTNSWRRPRGTAWTSSGYSMP